MSEWLSTCKEFGGPTSPRLSDCKGVDNSCETFKEGACEFDESNILTKFDGIDPEGCQVWSHHLLNIYNHILLCKIIC